MLEAVEAKSGVFNLFFSYFSRLVVFVFDIPLSRLKSSIVSFDWLGGDNAGEIAVAVLEP